MGHRRQAREIALKMLFQIDMGKLNCQEVIDYFLPEQKASEEVIEHARLLTKGVTKEILKIDRLITEYAHNWKIERIASVDRSLLRLATYELLKFPDIPKNVIINEAIEIAKKYSTEESSSFINGILDKIQLEKN